ncbi:AAA family ATPase [Hymenobacter properus]|uniref:AAA family ATPase n=1 Tax=Hymenobacter properus TaxID=2791026 RepID=A0A931BMW1_9BACT|nr:AAA family ATPase [Hymenobacter properus]MBF9143193.1 AAA family ATPase [Hymenobacter properus]MBR7722002.1 AAA family ATPase [Microvirga sp. SRT04]
MNEQLMVKNFGPIKDATVDFKRVTVFIGPTGGGKSTLAKLSAIFRDVEFYTSSEGIAPFLDYYGLTNFLSRASELSSQRGEQGVKVTGKRITFNQKTRQLIRYQTKEAAKGFVEHSKAKMPKLLQTVRQAGKIASREDSLASDAAEKLMEDVRSLVDNLVDDTSNEIIKLVFAKLFLQTNPAYIPSERIFLSSISNSWAGLMRDDIGLPQPLLAFANNYAQARLNVTELDIPLFNVHYSHKNDEDYISVEGEKKPLKLYEAASGIQSVTPLLILLERLSKYNTIPHSFIIEEPELNLYPAAQQGLLNWLVEKCTKDENDLTITTHSPYILSHFNLLLYAYQVGSKDEEKRAKVKAIIPEEYWINPDEFAAYYVNGPEGEKGVRSLVDAETKLISRNGLDTISGIQADQFDQLLDINSGF